MNVCVQKKAKNTPRSNHLQRNIFKCTNTFIFSDSILHCKGQSFLLVFETPRECLVGLGCSKARCKFNETSESLQLPCSKITVLNKLPKMSINVKYFRCVDVYSVILKSCPVGICMFSLVFGKFKHIKQKDFLLQKALSNACLCQAFFLPIFLLFFSRSHVSFNKVCWFRTVRVYFHPPFNISPSRYSHLQNH